MSDLDTRLMAAHEANDRPALIGLYVEAADQAGSNSARAYYLTLAFVFSLEIGSGRAVALRERLVEMGSEPASV